MIEHGITTTKADLWAHVCPQARRIYFYWATDMRTHIDLEMPDPMDAKSHDGTITGRGYLVRCDLDFIRPVAVPTALFEQADFGARQTDRQLGMAAERLFRRLSRLGHLPTFAELWQRTKEEQANCSGDFVTQPRPLEFEIKYDGPGGERPGTGNLFVQTHEYGHRATQVRSGERGVAANVETLYSPLSSGAAE